MEGAIGGQTLEELSKVMDSLQISYGNHFVEMDDVDEDGDTILHLIIIQMQPGIAKGIINNPRFKQILNVQNHKMQTPLHLAVITNQPELVSALLIVNVSLILQDTEGNTPLHIACKYGLETIVKLLIIPRKSEFIDLTLHRTIYDNVHICNYDGLPCIHLAFLGRHFSIMKLLIEHTDTINVKERKSGRTILLYVCGAFNFNKHLCWWLLHRPDCDKMAIGFDHLDYKDILYERNILF